MSYTRAQKLIQLFQLLFRKPLTCCALSKTRYARDNSVGSQSCRALVTCDFFVAVTANFQRLYLFMLLDIGTRRIVHWNLTDHPRSEWPIQQVRDGLPLDSSYHFVHDCDGLFVPAVDEAIRSMSLQVLKTGGHRKRTRIARTLHRDRPAGLFDWMIPFNACGVGSCGWISHCNRERPHCALNPGLADHDQSGYPGEQGHDRLNNAYLRKEWVLSTWLAHALLD